MVSFQTVIVYTIHIPMQIFYNDKTPQLKGKPWMGFYW
jgi:hypothetical protein